MRLYGNFHLLFMGGNESISAILNQNLQCASTVFDLTIVFNEFTLSK